MQFSTEDLKKLLVSRLAPFKDDAHKTAMQLAEDNARILALTMVGEGRGETLDGRVAIAWTVRNRVMQKGQTFASRCLQKSQYSCWWPFGGKDNYDSLMFFTQHIFEGGDPSPHRWNPVYQESLVLAGGVIDGRLRDRTRGSTHYLTIDLLHSKPPAWVAGHEPAILLGSHAFFAGIPWS